MKRAATKNYTDEELQAAVVKIVRETISRPYGALGNRRTKAVFGGVQDAAAGVFVIYPNAPYYIVKLAVEVLQELVASSQNTLGSLLDAVTSTDRHVAPVESISSLANARSALGALSTATEARTSSLTRIEDVPAFKRFDQSTARFLADSGKNVLWPSPADAQSPLSSVCHRLVQADCDSR